jgi:hypothetical protein
MKSFFVGILLTTSVWAETSQLIPAFLEASRMYIQGQRSDENLVVRPDISAALRVLELKKIDPAILEKYTVNKQQNWELREDDVYDSWVKNNPSQATEGPEIAVQALKVDVIEDYDDWLNDDIYAYFFITDGVIPTGKVTSIYRGLDQGQSFYFNEVDRAIFPLNGVPAKKPHNHLIVDYGIIESDGDDIKELQKLSSIIIDIALEVYASKDPQRAQVVLKLRKEIKALADMLLNLDHDDRLATGTVAYKTAELEKKLEKESYFEVSKKHSGKTNFSKWEYKIKFRFLRN